MRPWAYQAHEGHEANEAHEAHLAHPVHHAHSEMSMLDCPDDFHRESGSYTALKKTGYTGTDQPTDQQTDRRTDMTSYRDARMPQGTVGPLTLLPTPSYR